MEDSHPLEKIVKDYIEAFEARDLSRCLGFFHDNAELHFATGRFAGKKAIEQWHNDRFKGGMRLVKIEGIEVKEDKVIMHAVVTSPKLKFVRIDSLRGTGTFTIEQNKFKDLRMGLRKGYQFHI